MKKFLLSLLLATLLATGTKGQPQLGETRIFTLEETIRIARQQSPDALNARQNFLVSYYSFKTFRAGYLPGINFNANLPFFKRSYELISYQSGIENYVLQQYNTLSGELSIDQKIGFTGGSISLNSALSQTHNFGDSSFTSYLSRPIYIQFNQPLFQFNPYRWDRKIEPQKYEEAKRKYLEDNEQIAITAVNYFFSLLDAQLEVKISNTNLHNYDTLFRIAQGRYQLGKIAENDLLQLELSYLKAQASVENANLQLENALFRFKSYLRIKDSIPVQLIPPSDIRFFPIDPVFAISQANNNSSTSLSFKTRLLEAAKEVSRARWDQRFDADLQASFGLSKVAYGDPDLYTNPDDNQQVSLSLNIPILDWGVARGKIKMAQSQEEIVRNSVEQEIIDYQQNVYLKVVQFNMQQKQVMIAAKSDTVARKSYEVTKGRYLIGKINSILDLNNAQMETDNSQKSYYAALQTFWRNYFDIRRLTLYDFITREPIPFDITQIKL